jgi:recombination protein RecA
VEKSGAYYSWKGERIAQGRDNACKWMLENPNAAEEIRAVLVSKRKAENARLGAPVPEAAAA